jgi:hypothetical protein
MAGAISALADKNDGTIEAKYSTGSGSLKTVRKLIFGNETPNLWVASSDWAASIMGGGDRPTEYSSHSTDRADESPRILKVELSSRFLSSAVRSKSYTVYSNK